MNKTSKIRKYSKGNIFWR